MDERRDIGRLGEQSSGERGTVLIIAMVALVALAGLGGFTALSVQGGVAAQSASRFQGIALHAAESGVAAGIDFLRQNIDPVRNWTAFVDTNNITPLKPLGIPGNTLLPGDSGNLFTTPAWYEVTILNNDGDPGLGLSSTDPLAVLDQDARLVLRVVGHGPNGATVTLEVDVTANNADRLAGRPCPSYSQEGLAEDGSGRNDCLGTVNSNVTTFSPASP